MKTAKLCMIALMFIIAIAGVASAAQIPVQIDRVEIDDIALDTQATTRLDLERGETYPVEVRVTALQDIDDAEVSIFFSGFEYNRVQPAFDASNPRDWDANVTYNIKLNVHISEFFEEDDYLFRVLVSDRNNDELIQTFPIKIDVPRHSVQVRDVVTNPANSVKAGSALLTTVRVRNFGEKDEDDIKVTVSIPDLGISASEYVDEVENGDDEEETEEIFLRIPRCAKPGIYDVDVDVSYDNGFRSTRTTKSIQVTASEYCDEEGTGATPKTTITLGSQMESFAQGTSAVFPITIMNSGRTSKSYSLAVDSPEWGTVKITPTSTVVLDGGASQTLYAYVEAGKDAPTGAHVLTATVSSGTQALEQIALTANVQKAPTSWVKKLLEVALLVLVVLLVVIGLIIGFSKLKTNDDEHAETYY